MCIPLFSPFDIFSRLLMECVLSHVTLRYRVPLSFLQVYPHHAVMTRLGWRQPNSRPPLNRQRITQTKKRQKHRLQRRAKEQRRMSGNGMKRVSLRLCTVSGHGPVLVLDDEAGRARRDYFFHCFSQMAGAAHQ